MGLRVNIYRSDYDSPVNIFYGKKVITVVNVDGPFDPSPDAPAALLDHGPLGHPIIVPDYGLRPLNSTHAGPMNGGTIANSSDGRWHAAAGGPLPIHDRYETWAMYDIMSR